MPSLPAFDAHLSAAIDTLYAAFSHYPEPAELVGSRYEDVEHTRRLLAAAQLRSLSADQVGPFAEAALLTVGVVTDYKHYLPRIIELAALAPPCIGTDPPIIAQRLKRAEWTDWPKAEQTAIRVAFYTALSWTAEQHPGRLEASDWLCGLAALEEPLTSILKDWAANPHPFALLQAASLATNLEALVSSEGYWSYVNPEARRLIADWLISQERLAAFQSALDILDEDDLWLVERAILKVRQAT